MPDDGRVHRPDRLAHEKSRLKDLPWVLSANFQTRTFKYGPQKGDLIGVQTGQCLIDLDGFAHSVLDLHSVDREWRTDIYARDSLRRWFRGQSIAESVIGFSHTTIDPETFWLIPVLWVRITRNELAMYDAFISHAFEDKALRDLSRMGCLRRDFGSGTMSSNSKSVTASSNR